MPTVPVALMTTLCVPASSVSDSKSSAGTVRTESCVSTVWAAPPSIDTVNVLWLGSLVPTMANLVPVKLKEAVAPDCVVHMLVPLKQPSIFSSFQLPVLVISLLSIPVMPSGSGAGFSKPRDALNRPTSEICGRLRFSSPKLWVVNVTLTAVAVTAVPRTRRLAPIVPPRPKSVQAPFSSVW